MKVRPGQARGQRSEVRGQSQLGSQAAFTLIEILISSLLMSLILVSAYLCLNAAVSSQKLIEPRVEVIQNARVAMAIMAADLRGACTLSKDFDFLGMQRTMGEVQADNLDFATHNYTPRRDREGDFCQVSFFLDQDPQSGEFVLWRRRNPLIAPDPLSGGKREEIARGLRGLRFEYYDGLDWYDTWGEVEKRGKRENSLRARSNLSGLPEAVRITLWFDPNPKTRTAAAPENRTVQPPERRPESRTPQTPPPNARPPEPPLAFQTVARLNLTARSQRTSSGGNAGDAASEVTLPATESGGVQ